MPVVKGDPTYSTPIFHFELPGGKELARELETVVYTQRDRSKGLSKSNLGGWHSESNFIHGKGESLERLRNDILASLAEIGKRGAPRMISGELDLRLEGWANINPAGAYNAPHQHAGAHWSGVFYVKQPAVDTGEAGKIEFIDPRNDLGNWRVLKSGWFTMRRSLRPQPGYMVIFPSYLVHWVHPNDGPEDRISIAWNATYLESKQ